MNMCYGRTISVELKLLDSDKFNQITSRRHCFGKQILRKNQAKNKQKKIFKQFRCSVLT